MCLNFVYGDVFKLGRCVFGVCVCSGRDVFVVLSSS